MNKLTSLIIFVFIFNLSFAQELDKKYHNAVKTYINHVKYNNIDSLKTLVIYPLDREFPLPDIKNETEFKKRYNQIFDDTLKNNITESNLKTDWRTVGWRGIMLNNGSLWLDYDGKLIAVNYESSQEQKKRKDLIAKDKKFIHKSLAKFKTSVLLFETKDYRIRIDDMGNDTYRYASWPIDAEINTKPALIIENGNIIFDGNGGNHRYIFTNGIYKFECSITVVGENDYDEADLAIYKNENKILDQTALMLNH